MKNAKVLFLVSLAALLALVGCDREQAAERKAEAEESPVHFYREYVVVEPSEMGVRVDGLYYMRNVSGRELEIGIDYPFPVGGQYSFPYQIFLDDESDEDVKPMGYVATDRSIEFSLRFAPDQERRFRVRYAQQIRGGRATYIVTTTKRWGRPIEQAEFEIRIPPQLENPTVSIEPDRTETRGDTIIYYIEETDFYPDEDIVITWDD